MPTPQRSEVWLSDLGIAAKIRPGLVVPKRFLSAGAFDAQGLVSVAPARLIRKLGDLPPGELALVEEAVKRSLAL